jgi:hypothetical protein
MSRVESEMRPDRIRNLLANSTRQLIRNVSEQTQPHGHLKQIFLEHGFVSVEFLDHAIVGFPPHPFWFWRQIPLSGSKPPIEQSLELIFALP